MALAGQNDKPIELVIPTFRGDEITLIVRPPTDDEKDKFRRKRVKIKRGQPSTDYAVDVKFINMLLIGCKNIQIEEGGKIVDLDPAKHPNWKAEIDRDWKISGAHAFFSPTAEVGTGEEADDEGNFLSTGSGTSSKPGTSSA